MMREEILAAEAACTRLVHQYCFVVDDCDTEGFIEVFTEDGVWGRSGQPLLSGHDQLRAFFIARPKNVITQHLCSNVLVNVIDADNATGRSYVTVFRSLQPAPGGDQELPHAIPELLAEYADAYRRTSKGWRISKRVTTVRFQRPTREPQCTWSTAWTDPDANV
jgi:hypothetical protein